MYRFVGSTLLVGLGLVLAVPLTTEAQDIRYTTVTRAEFGGALGRIIGLMGGSDPSRETTYMKGVRLRTDDDDSSVIMDAEARSFTWIDHGSKSYYTATFQEMIESSAEMVKAASDSMAAAREEAEAAGEEQPEVEFTLRFAADRTGKRQKVAGFDAEQVFFTLEIDAVPVEDPEEEEPEEGSTEGMTLVFFTDAWLSKDFPVWKAWEEQGEEWAEAYQEEGSAAMSQAFAFDPRIQTGLERMASEMEKMEGTAIRTVTHVVALPLGMKFDRDKTLKDADRKLSSDVADAAAGAAKEGAREAVRGVMGRFGRRNQAEEPEEPEMTQATFMRVYSEVTDVDTATLTDDVFQPPAGYTQRASLIPAGA